MRTLGWIIGSLFVIDGLVALTKQREAISWADRTIGPKLPKKWENTLDEFKHVDKKIWTAWGINNILAGMGMLLIAMRGKKPAAEAIVEA